MVFTKPLNELGFEDIKALKDSIPESDILDYKADLIEDDKFVELTFGKEYLQYKSEVNSVIPKLKRSRTESTNK